MENVNNVLCCKTDCYNKVCENNFGILHAPLLQPPYWHANRLQPHQFHTNLSMDHSPRTKFVYTNWCRKKHRLQLQPWEAN